MAEDAVDDMYSNCREEMEKKVRDEYLKRESTDLFGRLWEESEKNEILKTTVKGEEALTKEHKKAILLYSSVLLHEYLNTAARTGKNHYGTTSFMFHSFYFWLTSAIQILNNNAKCYISYRRDDYVYDGNVGQNIRFGSFASSSIKSDLKNFGKKTCFKIKTCYGAHVEKYSTRPHEEEVLIPAYEVFTIKQKIQDKSLAGLKDCELVYVLESAGKQSNLDCKLVKNK